MFLSRLQIAQLFLGPSAVLTLLAILSLGWGPLVVGIFCLVLAHVTAAIGCYISAEDKGYPPILGIPVGLGLGVMGSLIFVILPDETARDVYAGERRIGRHGVENARRRDRGYEVLEDEEE
jgi:hypothetical protein